MKVKYKVFSNLYQDSVSLMQISAQISKLPGIQQASVVMGTPNNLEQLRDAGLGNEINASPNDLVIAVMGEEDICNEALILAQQRLTSKPDDETGSGIKNTGKGQPWKWHWKPNPKPTWHSFLYRETTPPPKQLKR